MATKTTGRATSLVPGNTFCIHVTNLSSNTIGEELSKMFDVPVESILLDTVKYEAWVKSIILKVIAETKADKCNGKQIGNQIIKCQAMVELIHIAKLCPHFRTGNCIYRANCSRIHIRCKNPDNCSQNNCYYGHSKQRPQINVDKINYYDPAIEWYRIKITGLPMGITSAELTDKLGKKTKGRYVIPSNQTSTTANYGTIAYLVGQTSEFMARKSIQIWRGQKVFPDFTIKYQLEIDQNDIDVAQFDPDGDNNPKLGEHKSIEPSQETPSKSQASGTRDSPLYPSVPSEDESNSSDEIEIDDSVFPPDLKAKKEWTYGGKPLGPMDTGQGEVFLIHRLSGTRDKAALKVYKRADEKSKRMRTYREMVALRTMGNENKYIVSNVSSLIDTNINNDYDTAMNDTKTPWIILKLALGCSLTEFIEQSERDIGFCEAIKFCIKLTNIVRSFHACGVVHRDLKPDNIHIDCSDNGLLDEGNITVLDFGLAYIEQNPWIDDSDFGKIEPTKLNTGFRTDTGHALGNRWYRVPQMIGQSTRGMTTMQKNEILQQRRSPSIDASSICAHLYWLLTKEIPGEEHALQLVPPPHEKIMKDYPNIWDCIIQQAIRVEEFKCSQARLKRYLFDVFDRGFADATNQWTVDQLLCHLNIMCNYLDAGIMNSDRSPNPISDLVFSSRTPSFFDQFSPAAHMFECAKNHFVEKSSSASVIYYWATKSKFRWINELSIHQRTNVDLLHYCERNFKMRAIEIYCVAKIDRNMDMNMFVGSIINGINIQLPVYTLTAQERNRIFKSVTTEAEMVSYHDPKLQDPFNEIFVEELHTLIRISH